MDRTRKERLGGMVKRRWIYENMAEAQIGSVKGGWKNKII
jgi:hypothetical protein